MKKRIPIFFASDDNYVPFLSVTVKSIELHADKENIYDIKVLSGGLNERSVSLLSRLNSEYINIEIINIEEIIKSHRGSLRERLRDYYSESIFYRIFIAELFPELDRAIYIDCDTVLVDDIAKLYDEDIGDNILGAVADESIPGVPAFVDYINNWVGVPAETYINSGVLLINLKEFRKAKIANLITEAAARHNLDTVAPDQDYLNYLCYGRIKLLSLAWNKQPKETNPIPKDELHLIHYNMFNKPWHYSGVLYEEEFWRVAELTPYFDELKRMLKEYTEKDRQRDTEGAKMLVGNAARLAELKGGFADTLSN